MKVLALDISKTCTGWAVDNDVGGPPLHGSWKGAADLTPGLTAVRFSQWLYKTVHEHHANAIAIERPIYSSSSKNIFINKDTSIVIVLAGFAMATAADQNMFFWDYDVRSVRKHFVGSGTPGKPKQVVFDRCKMMQWSPANFDEADAMALWCFAKAKNDPKFRPETGTPLFGGYGDAKANGGRRPG